MLKLGTVGYILLLCVDLMARWIKRKVGLGDYHLRLPRRSERV
jgi:hypothetical protein